MNYIKPKKLKRGELIGIISPASAPNDENLVESGVKYIESFGYKTTLGKNVGKIRGYLAGTDEERVEDIHQMFGDNKVKAIFCLRGGYGASRMLDKINYKLIRKNPKIFVGFSEITSLQMAFLKKSNLISFAGPMLVSNFSSEINCFTETNFWKAITSTSRPGRIQIIENQQFSKIDIKETTGRLVGGNLSVFSSLIGSGFLPELKYKILFLEEIDEPPYKIDRMLNQLKLNKIFKQLNGIILGSFSDCVEKDKNKKTLALEEVWNDYFETIKVPVIHSFPHGHIKDILTFPFGIKVKMNVKKGFVEIVESGVR
ncbi:MAG TPA: LD-carboxypeptidase [Ignavibacteriaceae bacterium]